MTAAPHPSVLTELLGRERSLPDAAALLAQYGVPVFPCVPGTKRPAVKRGFLVATTDLQQVEAWWRRWPAANLAVPTGAASGVDVVDVDRHTEHDGLEGFRRARNAGFFNGWAALVGTPSGGLHLYFPTDGDRPQRNWQAAPAHTDFRGEGGYVLVPPSRVRQEDDSLRAYELRATSPAPTRPIDARRLRDFLVPPRRSLLFQSGSFERPGRLASDRKRADWVAAQPEGNRNGGLFFMACRMVEDGIGKDRTAAVLLPAGLQAGLGESEILRTIESAYEQTGPKSGASYLSQAKSASQSSNPSRRPASDAGPVIS